MQIALTELLKSLNIEATGGIIGHSMGEIAAAYADGCVTLQQAMLIIYHRIQVIVDAKLVGKGAMAVVGGMSMQQIQQWLQTTAQNTHVVPACHNAHDSITLSGDVKQVNVLLSI